MECLTRIHPREDKHMEISLVEMVAGHETVWSANAVDLGLIQVHFEHFMKDHLRKGDVFWIWQWVMVDPQTMFVPIASEGRLVRRPSGGTQELNKKAVELFGGFLGWSVASTLMGLETIVSIEANPEVAKAAALAHGLQTLRIDEVWSQFTDKGTIETPAIWIADVRDHRVRLLLSILNVQHSWASPPCPPWCGMASLQGLNCADGMLFAETIRLARDIGMISLVMENARNVKHHPHFVHLQNFAEELGFNLVQNSVENCTGVLPLNRCRWLGCFVCHDACIRHVITPNIKLAREMQLPNDPFLGGLRGCHAVMQFLTDEDIQELSPCRKAVDYMSDPNLVPTWWVPGRKLNSADEVFKSRVTPTSHVMNGLVASYGKQHEFHYEYLESKGLCTTLISTPNGPRYYSPWEQAAALGIPEGIKLPKDIMLAWHIMGNALSIAHGILQLSRLHVLLKDASPFDPTVASLPNLCRAMQRKVIRLESKKQIIVDDTRVLVPIDQTESETSSGVSMRGNDDGARPDAIGLFAPGADGDVEPSSKRARVDPTVEVSPTVPFVVSVDHELPPQIVQDEQTSLRGF